MSVSGIKENKCFAEGLQGVCSQLIAGAAPDASYIYSMDNPANNARYVIKEYVTAVFGLLPNSPTPDFNFNITMKRSDGFTGTLNGVFSFSNDSVNAQGGTFLTIKWDNPTFDVTDSYTVIHVHIWYDGINWCGHVDGYS